MEQFLATIQTIWKVIRIVWKTTRQILWWIFINLKKVILWLARAIWWLIRWVLVKVGGEKYLDFEANTTAFWQNKITGPYYAFKDRFPLGGKLLSFSGKAGIGLILYWLVLETNFLYLTGEMPSTEDLANPELAVASEIFTADGKSIGRFFTENRTPVRTFEELPENLVQALVATEDARFYDHNGIDITAWGRSAIGILTGNNKGGGSTISQQVVKNLYKIRRKKGIAKKGLLGYIPYLGKLVIKTKEWVTAIKLERKYSKNEILLMYFNTVDFGSNAYGISTASRLYFSKKPKELNVQEGAVLVGLQKATTAYNPFLNPKRSKERRNTVIGQMAKYKYITQNEADSLQQTDLNVRERQKALEQEEAVGYEGYFKKYVADYLNEWAKKNDERLDLYTDGLRIITTIDSRMQNAAQKSLIETMRKNQRDFKAQFGARNPWTYENGREIPGFIDSVYRRTDSYKALLRKFPQNPDSVNHYFKQVKRPIRVFAWNEDRKFDHDPAFGEVEMMLSSYDSLAYYKKLLNGGMFSVDAQTGHVKAWVGGIDFKYFKYDHVRQSKRQPGSTFKPIVYCAAIDGPENLSPCFRVKDKPVHWDYKENGVKKSWAPMNADGRFSYREMTLRDALARSVNSVAAQVTDLVGADTVIHYAHKLGLKSKFDPVLSIGLGSGDASLYEMVQAYSTFINGGNLIEPQIVLRIEDHDGEVIADFEGEAAKNKTRVIKEESAFLVRTMLQGSVNSGGTSSRLLWDFNPPNRTRDDLLESFGGKTGTTSNYSDGWFMAVTPDLVTGVWVGGDDRSIHFRGGRGEGAQVALPAYKAFMLSILKSGAYTINRFKDEKEMGIRLTKDYKACVYKQAPRNPADETYYYYGEGGDSLGTNYPTEPQNVEIVPDSTM